MPPAGVPGPAPDLVLLHGTTIHRAQAICASQSFNATEPLYVVLRAHRDLAEFFARRKASRERSAAAVVRVTVPDPQFNEMRKRGEAWLQAFDHQDDPFLQRRNQWVISASGIAQLNRHLLEIEYDLL
jgi:hypothetical protein